MLLSTGITDAVITTQDVVIFSAIIGAAIAAAKGLVWFLDRFYGNKESKVSAAQSEKCNAEHSALTGILVQQNAHISKLLEHMGTFLHTAELRHQALLAQMAADKALLVEKLRNIYHQMPKRAGDRGEEE